MRSLMFTCLALGLLAVVPVTSSGQGMKVGTVSLQSVGPMAFTERGDLLIGDPQAATIYAVKLPSAPVVGATIAIENMNAAIAKAMEAKPGDVTIGELVTNPESGEVLVAAAAGNDVGLFRVADGGSLSMVDLSSVPHIAKELPNAPEDRLIKRGRRARNPRKESITDLAFFDGKVLVAGRCAGDSPSRVLEMAYPFATNDISTSVEIYHAAHGRVEDPTIRTFIPFMIDGKPSLLAGFTCTPLVRFSMEDLDGASAEKVRGTTVAELGNWNSPIDMVVYEKNDQSFILMTNTARGVMKISTDGIGENQGLSERVSGGGTAGQSFEKIEGLEKVTQLAAWQDNKALIITGEPGSQSLTVIDLP